MYYIGIDGGGTKTAFGLFDEEGTCLKRIEYSTCHFLQVGFDGCAYVLKMGVDDFVHQFHISPKELKIGIGIAGYGNDQNIRKQLEESIQANLKEYPYSITNDMHIAMIGSLNGQDGIAVVAGTGTIAMAQANNCIYRCGGWGYQLGDEGSAYWIGKQLLKEFCKQADNRQPRGELYDYIMKYFQIDNPYQMIEHVHNLANERTEIAKLSKICSELADLGHKKSCYILQSAGVHVSELVKGLYHCFDEDIKISYFGGVFQNIIFKESFQSQIHPHQCIEPIHDALTGAYIYAKMSL
ncbi:N-acetylglucosamine kinase [Candidatus Stoquefichus massiliensis]|uniref:N-acetylglucosamine kinase n=1 Tax=Candidatus Stoquefichus massiliensis TaxID=1470350 RepID=UPI000483560D|nr:BadF/BadG/BcrA/BcrD ATPase family protein [Candidatus Stoquefichus massiliensis]